MSNKFCLKNFGLLVLALGIGVFPHSAYAGFQWITPPADTNTPSTSQGSASTGAPQALSPIIIDGNTPRTTSSSGSVTNSNFNKPVIIEGVPTAADESAPLIIDNSTAPVVMPAPIVPQASVSVSPKPMAGGQVVPLTRSSRPGDSVRPPPPGALSVNEPSVTDSTFEPASAVDSSPVIVPPTPVDLSTTSAIPTPSIPTIDTTPTISPSVTTSGSMPPDTSSTSGVVTLSGSSPSQAPEPLYVPTTKMGTPSTTGMVTLSAAPPMPELVNTSKTRTITPSPVSEPEPAYTPPTTLGSPSATGMVTLSGMPPAPEPAFDASATPALQPAPTLVMESDEVPTPPVRGDTVHGFANHVPLAVALRQILPTGYGFSIDQNVDLGVLVSFKGGKAWRETLADTLAPVGLIVHEQGQIVEVGYPTDKAVAKASVAPDATAMVTLPSGGQDATHPHMVDSPSGMGASLAMDENSLGASMPTAPNDLTWNAEPGDTLHKVLETWAHRANVEFDWLAEYDYPIQASVHLKGKFEDAVRELLIGFETAHPQPIAELHSNSKIGQMVLVVTTRGNSAD